MAEEEETTTTAGEEIDLDALIGSALESRGITQERLAALDSLGGLEERLGELVKSSKPRVVNNGPKAAAFDEEGFLAKVNELIDSKLGELFAPGDTRPPLQRWLGIGGDKAA